MYFCNLFRASQKQFSNTAIDKFKIDISKKKRVFHPTALAIGYTLVLLLYSSVNRGYGRGFGISADSQIQENKYTVATTDTSQLPDGKKKLPSSSFIEPGAGLPHFAQLIKKGAPVKVAFLGGSITHMEGWRNKVMDFLVATYPQSRFEFLDAGIPSLGSVPHAFRFKTDVLDKMLPDLLFIESAVNDAGNGTTPTEQRRALEGIIRHAHKANPQIEMVLMAFADEEKNASYAHDSVPVCVQIHKEVAAYYHLPFINLAREVFSRIQQGEFSWEKDFKGLHPAPFGQQIYFNAIKTLLVTQIDKGGGQQHHKGLALTKWPKAMQVFNYSQGRYVDIGRATALQGFGIVDNWTPHDKTHTRPGFVHVPVLSGDKAGSELRLEFKGTAVGIAVLSGPDAGIIKYQIDAAPVKTMDLYTRWSNNLHLPWYELLADGLADKAHVLKLVIATGTEPPPPEASASNKPKTAVRIVHFLVNSPKS